MTVSIQTEPFTDDLTVVIDAYLEEQYDNTVANTDIPRYDHDWDLYATLAKHGRLLVVTARDDGYLVGYTMYVMSKIPHHKTHSVGICDGIVTWYTYRGQGIGRRMLAHAERELRGRDIDRMVNHYRVCYDTEPMFPKAGFKLIEHVYMKEL